MLVGEALDDVVDALEDVGVVDEELATGVAVAERLVAALFVDGDGLTPALIWTIELGPS